MPVAALLLALAALGGFVLSYAYDDDAPVVSRLAYGITTGLVVLAMGGYAGALLFGIGGGAQIAAILAAAPLVWLVRAERLAKVRADLRRAMDEIAEGVRRPGVSTVPTQEVIVVVKTDQEKSLAPEFTAGYARQAEYALRPGVKLVLYLRRETFGL